MPNTLYVEGYALDRFAEGSWALQPVHHNKVGLVIDAGIEEDLLIRHLQVADATRASLGLPVLEYIITDTPLEVDIWIDPTCGKSTGRIKQPTSLLRAVSSLVNQSKVNAIAVVGRFPDDDLGDIEDYRQGKGVDLLAGVEAVISHLVVKEFQIPCAHAPALLPPTLTSSLSPRSAAEEDSVAVGDGMWAHLVTSMCYDPQKKHFFKFILEDIHDLRCYTIFLLRMSWYL